MEINYQRRCKLQSSTLLSVSIKHLTGNVWKDNLARNLFGRIVMLEELLLDTALLLSTICAAFSEIQKKYYDTTYTSFYDIIAKSWGGIEPTSLQMFCYDSIKKCFETATNDLTDELMSFLNIVKFSLEWTDVANKEKQNPLRKHLEENFQNKSFQQLFFNVEKKSHYWSSETKAFLLFL